MLVDDLPQLAANGPMPLILEPAILLYGAAGHLFGLALELVASD